MAIITVLMHGTKNTALTKKEERWASGFLDRITIVAYQFKFKSNETILTEVLQEFYTCVFI